MTDVKRGVTEMTPTEKMFWAEIESGKATERSMVICYAYMRAQHQDKDEKWWEDKNRKIRRQFGWKRDSDEFKRFVASALGIFNMASKKDFAVKTRMNG